MRCMTDFARDHDGLGTLADAADLDRSAGKQVRRHHPLRQLQPRGLRRQFTYWMQRSGYLAARCWRAGENIAWGTGSYATVRSIFVAWLHSPEHRANLLGRYSSIGIALCGRQPRRPPRGPRLDPGLRLPLRRHPGRHRTPHIPTPHLGLRTAFRAH